MRMTSEQHDNARYAAAGLALVAIGLAAWAAAQAAHTLFETPLTVQEMLGKQAVVTTDRGEFIIDLLADAAPNHVGHFIESAEGGVYDGTIFHRMIRHGVIQGGDPLTKDPEHPEVYGQGGLGVLAAEISDEKHTRGAVSAVQVPGDPDSAGTQFFICVVDQPGLDGAHTVFGRVSEGMNLVTEISEAETDAGGRAVERIEIRSVTIRDAPPPPQAPFAEDSVEALGDYRAVIETPFGPITIEFLADRAPEHVRNFLRLSELGVYDGTSFHRVVRGVLIQTGWLGSRAAPLEERQQRYVTNVEAEDDDTPHVRGVVSMARDEDPNSASTSFFICTAAARSLDGSYTVFGRVVDGMNAVDAIAAMPLDGEAPLKRIDILQIRIER